MRTDADRCEPACEGPVVFGCVGLLAWHDVCPKNLSLAKQIAFVPRQMLKQGMKG
jgi:fumarate reductase iron-sulfur subunit